MTTSGSGERGLSRRDMIRGAAIAGAAAWTAPVIIESLTSPAGALTCVAPFFVTAGALASQVAPTATPPATTVPVTLAVVLPAGIQQNDFIMIVGSWRGVDGDPSATGYTVLNGGISGGSPATRSRVLYKFAALPESNPSVTFPNVTGGTGVAAVALVYRCVNTTTPLDPAAVVRTNATNANFTAPTYTTTNSNALVLNIVGGGNLDSAKLTSVSPWTADVSGAAYGATAGPQFIGVADIPKATAGAQAGSTWTTTSAAPANWLGYSFALQGP